MARRTDFRKATTYTGQKIKGTVEITYKIDGVRVLNREGFVTRNDKVPPGMDIALSDSAKNLIRVYGDCEVYAGSFVKSNSPMQQHEPTPNCLTADMVYPLDFEDFMGNKHQIDPRLHVAVVENPTPLMISVYLSQALAKGYEGLVLRTDTMWYRVKPAATADVLITGWFEQLDKHKNPKGILGGFETAYGNVTAFKADKRAELFVDPEQYVDRLIEVRYKELFPNGSFRYAVTFLRFRDDKDTESFDTKAI